MSTLIDSIQRLTLEEKIQLVEDMWDDIARHPNPLPISAATQEEVLRRAAWRKANPGPGKSLDRIVAELGVRL